MSIENEVSYKQAKERYAALGVDTDEVLKRLSQIAVSLQCWQGDDVRGFMNKDAALSGGIQVTGNYPGRARTPDELRSDIEQALALIPGRHKVNLHAIYADTDEDIDYDQIEESHYEKWVLWAKELGVGLDFNASFFSHPVMSASGLTLSSSDEKIRNFWIEHGRRSRRIAAYFGRELGQPAVHNLWLPDGSKDYPVDRMSPRRRLMASLDAILAEKFDGSLMRDAVECKLFGIGAEAYTVGSHEFYMGYGLSRKTAVCLDMGHFHPTESIADKLSSTALFAEGILLHISRPMRWDSDHVVLFDDSLQDVTAELVRNDLFHKTFIGLDFFDATVNRVAAWVVGTRNVIKALLKAMLEPTALLKEFELQQDFTARLALTEELKSYPWAAVWDYYCETQGVPVREHWLDAVKNYETQVLAARR
jgi:L-rhamnose isomerase